MNVSSLKAPTRVSLLRAARVRRSHSRVLRAELDSYRTQADRTELAAIMSRQTDQDRDQLGRASRRITYAA